MSNQRRDQRKEQAFTLLELLVVMVIVAALSAMALPLLSRITQHGRTVGCLSNLQQLGGALNLYLGEHNFLVPALKAGRKSKSEELPVIDNTLNAYAGDPRIFACPADTLGRAETTGTSYFWNSTLNGQSAVALDFLHLASDPAHIPILSDKDPVHPYEKDHVNVLYADGHATKDLKFSVGQ